MAKIKGFTRVSELNEVVLKEELAKSVPGVSENTLQRILLTVYALWVLQREYEEKEEEFQMIAKKGRTYIKEQGYPGKIEKLFKLIA